MTFTTRQRDAPPSCFGATREPDMDLALRKADDNNGGVNDGLETYAG